MFEQYNKNSLSELGLVKDKVVDIPIELYESSIGRYFIGYSRRNDPWKRHKRNGQDCTIPKIPAFFCMSTSGRLLISPSRPSVHSSGLTP